MAPVLARPAAIAAANPAHGPLRLVLATSAAMATLGNWPLWQALADLGLLQTVQGWGLAVALAVAVFGVLVALQSLLAWRYTLKPAAIALLLAAAAGVHFMLAYRIVIDQTMLVNVLQTNPGEAAELLGPRMAATLLLGGVLPAWAVWRTPVHHARWPRRLWRNALATLAALALVVVAVVASFQPLSSTMRNHKQLRYLVNPLNAVYGLGMVASEPLRRSSSVLLPLGADARPGPGHAAGERPPLLLLVLGETARAANFSLNGYARPTNPELARLPAAQRAKGVLLVMHQTGSHGPAYDKRVPPAFKRFRPECSTNNLQDCSREQLVNAYDNTIAYTDHFLALAIGWLQQRQASHDTALMYVSDHGESLGENNLYPHGLPYAIAPDVQKRVPWITWLSPGFARRQRLDTACLQGRADVEISHDHYFHSVLGLLDVQAGVYQPVLDAYAVFRGR